MSLEQISEGISNLDIAVIFVYFVVVLGLGLWISRKTATGEDLFLGGRTFGWGVIGLSLFASNISTTTLLGLSGSAYKSGIATSVYEWLSGVPLIVAAAIFVPLYIKSKITTIPEFLELRFDRRSRLIFSVITIFISIVVDTAAGLYAGALVMKIFFPDLILWQTCFVIAGIAGLYTAFGGLKAVVYTDAIQAIILIVGCTILTYMMFDQIGGSWSEVIASVPEGRFSVVKPLDDPDLPWTGLLLGVPFLGFWYWATNQYIVQRVLGAKDVRNARGGVMLAGFLKIIPLFIMVIPGALAIQLFPDIAEADQVLPTAIVGVLGPLGIGLVGLVLAGLVAAIMSSVDSTLNSASTLVVKDFIERKDNQVSEEKTILYGRITTFVLMVLAATWAPLVGYFDGIWAYLQMMFSIIVPPVVVLFLLGVFYKRGNGTGAFWTFVVGLAGGTLLFVLGLFEIWPYHFTTNVGLMVFICSLVFVLVSNYTAFARDPDLEERIDRLTYYPGLLNPDEGATGLADWRVQSALLAVLMSVLLYLFW